MNNQEFSYEFDILYNNITSNKAPGLDNYEKSVFLTMAQEAIITNFYNGKNPQGDSFEKTEEMRRYLSELIKTHTCTSVEGTSITSNKEVKCFQLPEDVWFITYEYVTTFKFLFSECDVESELLVVPVSQDTFHKIINNPFRGPNRRRAIRLDNSNNIAEIVSKYTIKDYIIRYITQPKPIILENLPEGLTINTLSTYQECELNPAIHRTILDMAVKLAKIQWLSNTGK